MGLVMALAVVVVCIVVGCLIVSIEADRKRLEKLAKKEEEHWERVAQLVKWDRI